MTIEISMLLNLISMSVAIFFALKNNKKTDVQDIETKAVESAKISIKLDNIYAEVRGIQTDITEVKRNVVDHDKKITLLEQSVRSYHHRLDNLGIGRADDLKNAQKGE